MSAAGYDAFADGLTAFNDDDYDRAISLFTTALTAGDLNARLIPVAQLQRARAYLAKNECALALIDLSAVLKANPGYFEALVPRATAYACLGNDAAAVTDLGSAIALRPNSYLYKARGHARWGVGDFVGASEDFSQTMKQEKNGEDPYACLWFVISRLRSGPVEKKELIEYFQGYDLVSWPGPLLKFFRGDTTAEQAARVAEVGDSAETLGRRCEANFYLAEWWIVQKSASTAKPLLEIARDQCPADFVESHAAKVELARLGRSKGAGDH